MSVLVVLIVVLFAFYLFYKTKYIRSNRPVEKKWLSAKSSIALGLFVSIFGINILFISQLMMTYIVAALFIIYGGFFTWIGFKKYKHYLPFAIQEAELYEAQK
ncbi:YtpI family protein [Neobacillus ginsengisoli]|uniref:Membrane protein YfcA n=1 Tax=Neobacillus ginsengisoli TaxID=904295 RepID=A0ABT9XNJ9_9BACI|nr:YtpI family protein [Neobacillus ginsengisoli]MDQ0197008.1 putative membrane protein YfcA [Neobacillus ginsengisoli]